MSGISRIRDLFYSSLFTYWSIDIKLDLGGLNLLDATVRWYFSWLTVSFIHFPHDIIVSLKLNFTVLLDLFFNTPRYTYLS
jgi:hypothetical protein